MSEDKSLSEIEAIQRKLLDEHLNGREPHAQDYSNYVAPMLNEDPIQRDPQLIAEDMKWASDLNEEYERVISDKIKFIEDTKNREWDEKKAKACEKKMRDSLNNPYSPYVATLIVDGEKFSIRPVSTEAELVLQESLKDLAVKEVERLREDIRRLRFEGMINKSKNQALEMKLKLQRNLLIALLVLIGLSAFISPVDVKVGDVCLSCWGK